MLTFCIYINLSWLRAVWFVKMTAAYALAMSETNKTKKRQLPDPSQEWTAIVVRFMKDQISEISSLLSLINSSSSSSSASAQLSQNPDLANYVQQPENSPGFRHWTYGIELIETMYYQGLLDRQEFLQWVLETVEKYRYPEDPIMRIILPLVLAYAKEFVRSELLSRKLAFQCAKKITYLVNETEAINQPPNSAPSDGSHPHPVMAAFIELMEDQYYRFILFGFSSILQTITLDCPAALVWNYFGENKTPSSLQVRP